MRKYREKQIIVEAEQFWPDKKPWPEGVKQSDHSWSKTTKWFYYLDTPDESIPISPRDYIITDADGNRYSCEAECFEILYEPIEA